MDMAAPVVLVIEGNSPRFFARLKELNAHVVYVGEEVPMEIALSVNKLIEYPLDEDWADLLEEIRSRVGDRPIDAVVTYKDRHVPLAAYLREELQAGHGPSKAAVDYCKDKFLMRQLLTEKQMPNAKYVLAADRQEIFAAAETLGFPLIVKPRSGVGGLGVTLCSNEQELSKAVDLIEEVLEILPEFEDGKAVLVEEYLNGTLLAVQTLTRNGQTEILNIVQTTVGPFPHFLELEHVSPPVLSVEDVERVEKVVLDAIEVFGLDQCVTHMQLCLVGEQPIMVEVNPRVPGGSLVDMTEWTTGVNLYEATIDLSLGLDVTRGDVYANRVRSRSIGFAEDGVLHYDAEEVAYPSEEGVLARIDVNPGEVVYAFDHPEGGIYGRVLVGGQDEAEVERKMNTVWGRLELDLQ